MSTRRRRPSPLISSNASVASAHVGLAPLDAVRRPSKADTMPSADELQPKTTSSWCSFTFACSALLFLLFIIVSLSVIATVLASNNRLGHYLKDESIQRLSMFTAYAKLNLTHLAHEARETPGDALRAQGIVFDPDTSAPVLLIPGVISTGLEVWQGHPCMDGLFRERIWGSMTMVNQLLTNLPCWLKHMALNTSTGLDPEGIRLRAAKGLTAADYFLPGLWVWARVIESFADIGYDSNNMDMLSYDWRLSPHNLELRDGYMTQLRHRIELMKRNNGGKRVNLISHSMGGNVLFYFLKWVEHQGRGNMGWVNDNIASWSSIGTPFLGVPKAYASLLSGEMRDTAQLHQMESIMVNTMFGAVERRRLMRSWDSIASMLPKGGNRIWGTPGQPAPDQYGFNVSISALLHFHDDSLPDMGTSEAMDYLYEVGDDGLRRAMDAFSYDYAEPPRFQTKADPVKWTNVLESTLPRAPDMKIFCLYGIGKSAERSYYYHLNGSESVIDTRHTNTDLELIQGVQSHLGDGTVPLISLAHMCLDKWKKKTWNPYDVPVVAREYPHQPSPVITDVRGGKHTADHVDILGNSDLLVDLIRIAVTPDSVTQRVLSQAAGSEQ